jgi:hypothetical protein
MQSKTAYNLKGNKMKALIATIVSVFALSAFAADAPKADAKPVATTAAPAPHKADKKAEVTPAKSEAKAPAKAEPAKAATTK